MNGVILAESDHTEVVERNHYFLPEPVNLDFFRQSGSRTSCPWKRDANHYTVEAGGDRVEDDAWYYPRPQGRRERHKGPRSSYGSNVRVEV